MRRAVFAFAALLPSGCATETPAETPACVVDGDRCGPRGLCEGGACVEPWAFGSPEFDGCRDAERAAHASLEEAVARAEELTDRLLIPEGAVTGVRLAPGSNAETATVDDIVEIDSGDNDGLWSALGLAAAAYRYAVTRDADALARVDTLLAAEELKMDITGVKGLFARAVTFSQCPTRFEDYVPLERKDGNQWVRVGDDGCLQSATPQGAFVSSSVCGLERFAGGCWKDDVSKDELAGHVYALGVVGTVVDDPEIHGRAARLLSDLADHLIENDLTVVDWDGRTAEHGRIFAMAFDDFPGLNAGMALGFLMTAASVTGREDIWNYVETCLVPEGGGCLPYVTETPTSYLEHLRSHGLWVAGECGANFNNIAMHTLSLADIVLHARDPAIVDLARVALRDDVMQPDGISIGGLSQRNPWYGLMYAQLKDMSDGPAFDVVTQSACLLRQLPAVWTPQHREPRTGQRCDDRLGKPMFDTALDPSERCPTDFLWWKSPYGDGACSADPSHVRPTTSLLLPYWLGRYTGFFDDTM